MCLPFKDNGRNSFSKPWEIENFSSFAPISRSSLPAHRHKISFSKLTRIDLLFYKVQSVEAESCSLSKHVKLGDFFNYIFRIIGKKAIGG